MRNAPIFFRELSAEDREFITANVSKGLTEIKNVDLIFLKNVPNLLDDGSINPLINALLIARCTHPENIESAPYITLSDWESSYAKLKTTLQSDTPRMRRRLMKMGKIEFGLARNLNEVEEITKDMFKQKAYRFLDMGVKNVFEDVNCRNFYIKVGEKAYQEGYLHISWLSLNGIIIAAHWGILFNNRLYVLLLSFNREYRRLSIGRLKTEDTVHWCCDNNIKIFDFCLGGEKYKSQWTDTYMTLYRFLIPVTLKGYVFNIIYRYIRPGVRRISRFLRNSAAYRKIRAALNRQKAKSGSTMFWP